MKPKQEIGIILSGTVVTLALIAGLTIYLAKDSPNRLQQVVSRTIPSNAIPGNRIASEVADVIRDYYQNNVPITPDISTALLSGLELTGDGGAFHYKAEFEKVETKPISSGTVEFNGRQLPAAIVEARITYANRLQGIRKTKCYLFYQADDNDFKMNRDVMLSNCDGSPFDITAGAGGSEAAWKTATRFQPN